MDKESQNEYDFFYALIWMAAIVGIMTAVIIG